MIIGGKINEIETFGVSSKKATINQDRLGKLQFLLTKGLYSDPESAVIVEWANNGVDSVVQAGKDPIENPVIVKITENSFSVQDFGLGLDKNDFETVCMDYLNSTKEQSNETIGAFGLGLKSFLSLNRSAIFTCVKNGYKWKFLAYEGVEFMEYDLLSEGVTDEINGVICEIKLNNYREYTSFVHKAKEKLAYYDTVVLYDKEVIINNNIIRSEDWQFSSLNTDNYIHLALKDVYYKIDYTKLGISSVNVPIALRFSLSDGLQPTPSRESLIWNTHTINIVKEKIIKVSEWFINKYNETNKEFKSLDEIFQYYNHSYRNIEICEEQFEINELEKHSSVKMITPTYKNIVNLPLDTVYREWKSFLENYKIVSDIHYGRFSAKNVKKNVIDKINGNIYLIGEEQPKKIVIDYLKEKHDVCYFVRKLTSRQLKSKKWNYDSYESILQLKKFPKSQWRILINEWNILENELIQKLQSLPVVPKEFIESKKKARVISDKYKRISGEINFKIATDLEKYSQDWQCKFVSKIINLKDFHKRKKLMVYSLEENRQKLDYLFQINDRCRSYSNLEIAVVGKKDYETLKEIKIHNLVSMEQFIKSKYKVIARYVAAYKINKLIDANKEVFRLKDFIIKNISANFGELLKDLSDYAYNYDCKENELMEELIQFCDENKYYDYPVYQTYTEVEKEINKINFIRFFTVKDRWGHVTEINPEAVVIIKELLISRKFRMDYTYYNKAVTPETELINEEELVENEEI